MVPTIKLNNNLHIPVIGLGSSQAKPGEMEEAIKEAIDIGYRNFDSATIYENDRDVGAAARAKIIDGTVKREDLFITNKLWNTFHGCDLVVPACKNSLKTMGLEYLDLYLIHFPMAMKDGDNLIPMDENKKFIQGDADYIDTWKGMEECVKLGLTKGIGLSNFNSEQIQRILDIATIKPVVNQIECHPYMNQNKLIKFCKERGIEVMAYAPLGRPGNSGKTERSSRTMKPGVPSLLEDETLSEIAVKHHKTVAQVILRYLIQHGTIPIPKSSNKKRLKENIDIFDFELSTAEVTEINSLNNDNRFFIYPEMMHLKYYPFNIEF